MIDILGVTEARDRAMQTPDEVRRAFMTRHYHAADLSLAPWCIGIMWILELTGHPLVDRKAKGDCQHQDVVRALFAFASTEEAYDAAAVGVAELDRQAFAFVRKLPVETVRAAEAVLPRILREGMETVPGGEGGGESSLPGVPAKNNGLGWVLTLLDCLLNEYTWPSWQDRQGRLRGPDDYLILKMPLSRAFALLAAVQPRYGVEASGPTYVDAAVSRAMRERDAGCTRFVS